MTVLVKTGFHFQHVLIECAKEKGEHFIGFQDEEMDD
jgi:hypothetical protein